MSKVSRTTLWQTLIMAACICDQTLSVMSTVEDWNIDQLANRKLPATGLNLGSTLVSFISLKVIQATHWAPSFVPQNSHFGMTWTWVSGCCMISSVWQKVLGPKNPPGLKHPIQRPIQPRNNGVEWSSTFTGLITHLTGTHTRFNSCIMSAVWSIDLPTHCMFEGSA